MFGTLLALGPLDAACDGLSPGRGAEIAARWRARQLEASWLRTVMDRWADFDVVTRDALAATLVELAIPPPDDLAAGALAFEDLPPVDGARDAVQAIHAAGIATGILTNASTATLARAADRLALPFDHRLSVDAVRRFKPHPSVYGMAVEATGLPPDRIGFVTSNGWDAAGAATFGLDVVWLRPVPSGWLPAVGAPEIRIATWPELPGLLGARRA